MNQAATIARLERCRLVAEGRVDTTEEEKAEFATLVAREYARYEARHAPVPQLQLPEAA